MAALTLRDADHCETPGSQMSNGAKGGDNAGPTN
jgi:hypothetical protein